MKTSYRFWIMTVCLLLATAGTLVIGYGTMSVLGIAAYVSLVPLLVFMALTIFLIVLVIRSTRRLDRGGMKIFGWGSSIFASTCMAYLLYWVFILSFGYYTDRFILPKDFRGEVRVFHEVRGAAEGQKSFFRRRTYHVGNDGVILVPTRAVGHVQFFTQDAKGRLHRIETFAPTLDHVINPKKDDAQTYVSIDTPFGQSSSNHCPFEIQIAIVGSSADIVSYERSGARNNVELDSYALQHPELCASGY